MTSNEVVLRNKIGEVIIHHGHVHVLTSGPQASCADCSLTKECVETMYCDMFDEVAERPLMFVDKGFIKEITVEQWHDEDPQADRLRRDGMETGPEHAFDPNAK